MTLPTTMGLHLSFLLSACDTIGGTGAGLAGTICSVVGGAADAIGQASEVIQNPFRWLYHHTLGAPIPQHPGEPGWAACQADWSQPTCPKLIDQLNPSSLTLADAWPRLYSAFAVSGLFIAMTCCVVRVVRGVFDARADALHLVVDNVSRAIVATGLLIAPTPQDSLLLTVMRTSAAASGRIATAAAAAVMSAFTTSADLGRALGNVAAVGFGLAGLDDFLVAIPLLLVAVGFVYVLALYLVRVVQLVFAVATAPLFVAVAAYDHRNRFVQWWLDLFTSAMLLPIILGVCGALTAGVAMFFLGGNSGGLSVGGATEALVRTLLACFSMLGGIWMTGKAAHGLAWRSFSHGGITGAATAVSTAIMALPNAAGDVGTLLRLGGGGRGGGAGALWRASRSSATPASVALPGDTAAALAAAAAGHATAMIGESAEVDAAIEAAGSADFSRHAAVSGVLTEPSARQAFNRAVGAAVGRFAAGAEGRGVVAEATAHLAEAAPSPAARAAAYTRALAGDEQLSEAVAGVALASLLHNQAPDLRAVLRSRTAAAR